MAPITTIVRLSFPVGSDPLNAQPADRALATRPLGVTQEEADVVDAVCQSISELPMFVCSTGIIFQGSQVDNPSQIILLISCRNGPPFSESRPAVLSPVLPFLTSPPQIDHVAFTIAVAFTLDSGPQRVIELITWSLPTSIDQAVHEELSRKLEEVDELFLRGQPCWSDEDEGDMITSYTGWAQSRDESVVKFVFLIKWYNRESELRFKDSGLPNRYNTAEVVDHAPDGWYERAFMTPMRDLESKGMISESISMHIHEFQRR
ncbi:hypothetical protein MMC24_007956 [Lignoscripta atroalba]|nr:hypothetical protein [Lignoscripta atroalba]